jgi:hypothetical protein
LHAPDVWDLQVLEEEDEPFVLFFEPPTFDQRIASQGAVLSVMSDPTCDLEEWLDRHEDAWRAWRIPSSLKAEVRERLDQNQITERALMPGLDGLAAWLRRYYSPKRAGAGATGGGASMDGREEHEQQEGSMT